MVSFLAAFTLTVDASALRMVITTKGTEILAIGASVLFLSALVWVLGRQAVQKGFCPCRGLGDLQAR